MWHAGTFLKHFGADAVEHFILGGSNGVMFLSVKCQDDKMCKHVLCKSSKSRAKCKMQSKMQCKHNVMSASNAQKYSQGALNYKKHSSTM